MKTRNDRTVGLSSVKLVVFRNISDAKFAEVCCLSSRRRVSGVGYRVSGTGCRDTGVWCRVLYRCDPDT
jgi:hypothetical protein